MFRYWDGRAWSAALSPHPGTTPPPAANLGTPAYGAGQQLTPVIPPPRRRPWGWLLGLGAVLVAVILIVVFVVQRGGDVILGNDPPPPSGTPSSDVCPEEREGTPEPQPGDDRVHAGKMSYPRLGSPWSAPEPESRVAFGKGVLIQHVQTETQSDGQPWLAAVLVGELVAGDGFFTPKDGAAIVVKCVSGTFYGNSAVTRNDRRNEAIQVDGHDAWIIESSLGFDIPGLEAKSERLIVVIVDTGTGSSGLFYASIPENALQYLEPAQTALDQLTVDD